MIRVYLDWNVFSRLGSKDEIHQKLTGILNSEGKFLIPYSEAHLMDIYRSYKKVGMVGINGHLEKLEEYSKSLFLTDTIKNKLEFQNLSASEAMQQYIDAYAEQIDFNFTELMKPFESALKPLLSFEIKNPLTLQEGEDENAHKKRINNFPRTAKDVQNLLGDGETTSYGQIMDNLLKMACTLHTDHRYNEMRDNFQKDFKVNTGRLNSKKFDPMETLNENAQKLEKENFMELYQSLLIGNDEKSFFNRIIALCRQLDFNGFFADNITPEHHLDNIETDYKHIAYASTCDFFVIADKKTKEKAVMAFKLLKINITVLSPQEFVTFFENNSAIIENDTHLIDYLFWLATSTPLTVRNGFQYYYISSYVLDYFNFITVPADNSKYLLLQKCDSPNYIGILFREITTIKNKLNSLFGESIAEHGEIGDESYFISWMTEDLVLVDFRYAQGMIVLEVKQLHKMKFRERIFTAIKSFFKKKIGIRENNV
jgi:hypothetical protein